jgi:hypothetical protein
LTAQGSPRARFRRAIEGGWVFHAELAARKAGNLTLAEALELVCLYAEHEPAKFERTALWHVRYVSESSPTLLRTQIALAALAELRAGSEHAESVLRELATSEPASRQEIFRMKRKPPAHTGAQPRRARTGKGRRPGAGGGCDSYSGGGRH